MTAVFFFRMSISLTVFPSLVGMFLFTSVDDAVLFARRRPRPIKATVTVLGKLHCKTLINSANTHAEVKVDHNEIA